MKRGQLCYLDRARGLILSKSAAWPFNEYQHYHYHRFPSNILLLGIHYGWQKGYSGSHLILSFSEHRHWHDHHQSDQGQCSGADSVILTWVAPGLRLNGSIGGLAATSMSQYSGFGSAAAVSTEFHQKTGNLRFSSPEGFAMLGVTLMGGLCVQVRACHLPLQFLFIFCSENFKPKHQKCIKCRLISFLSFRNVSV